MWVRRGLRRFLSRIVYQRLDRPGSLLVNMIDTEGS